jgi:hypothetical protein
MQEERPRVERPPSLTMDDSSEASNPGDVDVQWTRWFRVYPKSLVYHVIGPLALPWILLVVEFWILGLITMTLGMLWAYIYVRHVVERMQRGNVCEGVVVQLDPLWIAVGTDLSTGDGEYPAVKIMRCPVKRLHGRAPFVGARLATVAVYQAQEDDDAPYWKDFFPIPVDCATRDAGTLQRTLDSIDPEDFESLVSDIARLPSPLQLGLYRMWQEPAETTSDTPPDLTPPAAP